MKRLAIIISLILVSVFLWADCGTWRMYISYSGTPQDIESADKFIYVQVNENLYSYNRNDHSIKTFSRMNLLSDVGIKFIAWAKAVKKLAVVYSNGNIDLITKDGTDCENISTYYTKNTTADKTINHIYVKDNTLLLATNFGVVNIDLRRAEIYETYRLKEKFKKVAMDDKFIYALTSEGNMLYKGDRKKNILDPAVWTKETFSNQVDFSTVNDQINADDEAVVKTLAFDDAPKNNQISTLLFDNGRLLVAAGGWREGIDNNSTYQKPCVSEYKPNAGWRDYEEFQSAASVSTLRPVSEIIVIPFDKEHVFFATKGNGIYEYKGLKQQYNYTYTNTDAIKPAVSGSAEASYVHIFTAAFVSADELLMINSYNYNPVLKLNLKDKSCNSFFFKELLRDEKRSHPAMVGLMKDSRGLYWFGNNSYTHPALYCLDLAENKIYEYNNFINQDDTKIDGVQCVACIVEDDAHNIWVATNVGPLMLSAEQIGDTKAGFIQVKVPRNDGSNYADYLLSGVNITCIAIDGAGRKWFGTDGNGVYLISADNMEQVEHFTKDNSMLLSNEIIDIAINSQLGEVFFATPYGLCSYMSDATQPNDEMTKDNVWAYPNPVRPEYKGYITITGLSLESRITITTSSGHIVASGISTGGSFKWNGCDTHGQRVASGVYMVHAATREGESGVVCKVAVIN